jgi:SAM-dependent methyltransferase
MKRLIIESILVNDPCWDWNGDKLFHKNASQKVCNSLSSSSVIAQALVRLFYARQNRTHAVGDLIQKTISDLKDGSVMVSFGSGNERIASSIINLDVFDGPNVDIVGDGSCLPFRQETVDLVIAQEVFEHLASPSEVIDQVFRVLKTGGFFIFQVPFLIGYHPDPFDYWRFSRDAFDVLFPSCKWKVLERRISVGHGTALQRVLVEFVAVTFSIFGNSVYKITKGISAIVFSPLVLFDLLTPWLAQPDRIPGGYILLLQKR